MQSLSDFQTTTEPLSVSSLTKPLGPHHSVQKANIYCILYHLVFKVCWNALCRPHWMIWICSTAFFFKSGIFGRPRKNNRKRQGYEWCHASRGRARPPRRFCCTDRKSLTLTFDLSFADSASGYREEFCRFTLDSVSEQPLLSFVHANTQHEFHPLHSPLTAR